MKPGDLVSVQLNSPREQLWGVLLRLDQSGIELRGIELGIFEEWCTQLVKGQEIQLGPTTLFFPAHRIERVSLDEQVGTVPSVKDRFKVITGKDPRDLLIPRSYSAK
jgi:hypothetical protein